MSRGSKPIGSLLVLAVVAIALALGAVGGATAAALTPHAVKKIAAKVVKKQAPSLSVAHATAADSATKAASATSVDGLTAAQLQTTGYRYLLPTEPSSPSRKYTFPGLPTGTYLAAYSFTVDVSAATVTLACTLAPTPTSLSGFVAPSYTVNSGLDFARGGASGSLTTSPTTVLKCDTFSGTFQMDPANDNTVTFIPLDSVVSTTPVSAPPAGPRSGNAGDGPAAGQPE